MAGFPVGSRRIDYQGFETDNLKVLAHSHIKRRQHYWTCECKHCGGEFVCQSSSIKTRLSCGCMTSTVLRKKLSKMAMHDVVQGADLLRRAWV